MRGGAGMVVREKLKENTTGGIKVVHFDCCCYHVTCCCCCCIFLQAMSQESTDCPAEELDSEDKLFMLYTSGSTGKPKGIVHTQAGYLLYASLTQQVRAISH